MPSARQRCDLCVAVMCRLLPSNSMSYTVVIPVPSFRAPDSIRSDIKVFNSIGDYGMSFFSHLEQVTTSQNLGHFRRVCSW